MSHLNNITSKIYTLDDLHLQVEQWKMASNKVVFTNGCFDIIHRGHIEVLARTADLGDKLIIGLNSDQSIQKLKGKDRPIIDEQSRAFLLAALSFVDAIVLFSEDTDVLASIFLDGYRDNTHMNLTGQEKYAKWLTKRLHTQDRKDK